jgi:mitogen-activated protein kinase kinase kinase
MSTGQFGGSVRSSWNSGYKNDGLPPVPRKSISPRSSLSGSPRPSSSRRQAPHPSRLAEEEEDAAPHFSTSTDDDHSSTETDDDVIAISKVDEPSTPHVLPPVSFESESLSESMFPRLRIDSRPSSRRFSYTSEMKSKRRSTASTFLTVDEITAEMDNRQNGLTSDTTAVETSEEGTLTEEPEAVADAEDEDEDEDGEDTAEELSDEGEPSEGDVESAAEEDDVGKAVTSTGRK